MLSTINSLVSVLIPIGIVASAFFLFIAWSIRRGAGESAEEKIAAAKASFTISMNVVFIVFMLIFLLLIQFLLSQYGGS